MADSDSAWESLIIDLIRHPAPSRKKRPFTGDEFCAQCSKIDFEILFNGPRSNWVISRTEDGTYDKFWTTPPQRVHYLLNDVAVMLQNRQCPMCRLISTIWQDEFKGKEPVDEQCFLTPVMSYHAYMRDMEAMLFVSETDRQFECAATHVLIRFQPGHRSDLNLDGMTIGQYRPSDSYLTAWQLETHSGMLNLLRSSLSRSTWVQRSIDWSSILRWLQICREHHPECARTESHKRRSSREHCREDQNSGTSDAFRSPIKCIDVESLAIRVREAHEEYATLSWVWGDSQVDRTKVFHADMIHLNPNELPATIQDAIAATKQLGQRLLWVDVICINQNDQQDLLKHINQMDVIYTESVFTLCAATGTNGESGLAGVKPDSRPHRQEETVQARDHTIFARPAGRLEFRTLLNQSAWRSRGWTFQEELLSRRLIIFTDQEVLFMCKVGTGRETMVPPRKDLANVLRFPTSISAINGKDAGSSWTFDFYRELVHKYLSRQLTYQKDTLNAFRGLEKMLFNQQGMSFCSGLPEADLLNALMWVHTDLSVQVKRKHMFPSWSWAEWEGRPKYVHWEGPLTQHTDGKYLVEVSTQGEGGQLAFLVGNSDVVTPNDSDENTSRISITGQTAKLQVRRCRRPKEVSTTPGATDSTERRTGLACEVFDSHFSTYIDCLDGRSTRQRNKTSTSLYTSGNPGLEEYVSESDRSLSIPFILYLDRDTSHDPFEVECIFLTGWIDQRYEGTISCHTDLGKGWHHVVVLAFERSKQTEIQRLGLMYLDVRTWLAMDRTAESLTLI